MWYFTWILGVLLACALGVINVMWYEITDGESESESRAGERPGGGAGP